MHMGGSTPWLEFAQIIIQYKFTSIFTMSAFFRNPSFTFTKMPNLQLNLLFTVTHPWVTLRSTLPLLHSTHVVYSGRGADLQVTYHSSALGRAPTYVSSVVPVQPMHLFFVRPCTTSHHSAQPHRSSPFSPIVSPVQPSFNRSPIHPSG